MAKLVKGRCRFEVRIFKCIWPRLCSSITTFYKSSKLDLMTENMKIRLNMDALNIKQSKQLHTW